MTNKRQGRTKNEHAVHKDTSNQEFIVSLQTNNDTHATLANITTTAYLGSVKKQKPMLLMYNL